MQNELFETSDTGKISWKSKPASDATDPELVGSRQQRVVFYTQLSLDDVVLGLSRLNLKLLNVEGSRYYSHTYVQHQENADGSISHHQFTDTALGGLYRITVSNPRS